MAKFFKLVCFSYCLIIGCSNQKEARMLYKSDTLSIQQVAEGVYLHTSFLSTESFGNVPCNGMIVTHGEEAFIFDTPAESVAALELIEWVEEELGHKIKGVVSTHFHADCLGGLEEFHHRNIPSYAHNATIAFAKEKVLPIPERGFAHRLELKVGDEPVLVEFLGEGHTKDNVIGYFPASRVLFGGCLIKEQGAGKGNLEDANISAWPNTVAQVKEKYPDAKIVIPGHGQVGGPELLDYTIALFQ